MSASTFSDLDGHATIYSGPFNPAAPITNALYIDDDSGPPGPTDSLPQFTNVTLNSGVTYTLVSTTFNEGVTGSYTWTLSGAGSFTLGSNSITLGCPTNTPTSSPTATSTATNTATLTPSNTPTETVTNTATLTPSSTATLTATNTATSTATLTPSNTPSATATDTATNTATLIPSNTATSTETPVPPTNTQTATPTDTVTNEPTETSTNIPAPTATETAANTATNTPTDSFTATPTDIPDLTATSTRTPVVPPLGVPCEYSLPVGSVQGRMIAAQFAYYDPNPDATSTVFIPGGTSWWIIDKAAGYYRIWIACQAPPVWVSAFLMTPNYDSVWNGQALP